MRPPAAFAAGRRALSRRAAWITPLLLALALGTGGWRLHGLSRANAELARRNAQCASLAREVAGALRRAQASAPRRGARAPAFTLLGTGRRVLALDPDREPGTLHVLFADPAQPEFSRALADYRRQFGSAVAARRLLVTVSGPERVAPVALGVAGFEVGVHGGEVARAYGFRDAQGLAVIEDGVLRERWRLPRLPDELPIPD